MLATNDHHNLRFGAPPCKVHYWWSWSQSGERYCGGFWCLSWVDAAQYCLDGCKLDTSCELDKCLGGSGRLPKRQRVSHCDFVADFVMLAWFCYMNSWVSVWFGFGSLSHARKDFQPADGDSLKWLLGRLPLIKPAKADKPLLVRYYHLSSTPINHSEPFSADTWRTKWHEPWSGHH